MRLSHRAQQVIAVSLGIVLIGVITATLIREYGPNDTSVNNDSDTSVVGGNDTKQDDKDGAPELPKQDTDSEDNSDSPKNFEFTTQPGASFTALARNALRQYAAANNLSLTDAQVEKAAATLALNAGMPFLEIGQVVVITNSDVSNIIGVKTETTPQSDSTKTPPVEDQDDDLIAKSYNFIATSGDAYSVLARSAIGEYAKSSNIELTGARRIAAETYIISDTGFPRLAIGQQVTFTQITIKNAVEKTLSLSTTQLTNWQPYANLAGL